jgi:hypothetical protein
MVPVIVSLATFINNFLYGTDAKRIEEIVQSFSMMQHVGSLFCWNHSTEALCISNEVEE